MKKLSNIIFLLLLAAPGWCLSDEQECMGVDNPAEKIICSDEYLYSLDRKLLGLTDRAILSVAEFDEENNNWLLNYRNKCEDHKCLLDLYLERISFVEKLIFDSEKNSVKKVEHENMMPTGVKIFQPSFSCEEATVNVELMICSNETLAMADKQLAQLLLSIRSTNIVSPPDQEVWIAEKRNKCRNSECLSREYLERILYIEDAVTPEKLINGSQSALVVEKSKSIDGGETGSDGAITFSILVGILGMIFAKKPKNCFVCGIKLDGNFSYIRLNSKKQAVCCRCRNIISCAD